VSSQLIERRLKEYSPTINIGTTSRPPVLFHPYRHFDVLNTVIASHSTGCPMSLYRTFKKIENRRSTVVVIHPKTDNKTRVSINETVDDYFILDKTWQNKRSTKVLIHAKLLGRTVLSIMVPERISPSHSVLSSMDCAVSKYSRRPVDAQIGLDQTYTRYIQT